jgi:hypothetical protein
MPMVAGSARAFKQVCISPQNELTTVGQSRCGPTSAKRRQDSRAAKTQTLTQGVTQRLPHYARLGLA